MEVFLDYLQETNFVNVLVAVLAGSVVGFVWYAKPLFGARWQQLTKLTDKKIKQANMGAVMGTSLVTAAVSALGLSLLVDVLVLSSAYQGALLGVMVAVAFVSANKLSATTFEQRSRELWLLNSGGDIAIYAVMGAVLAWLA